MRLLRDKEPAREKKETDLNHKHPDAEIAEGNHCDGNQEVDHHYGHCVGTADILGEGAGVDPRVVAQGTDKKIGDNGHHCEEPD